MSTVAKSHRAAFGVAVVLGSLFVAEQAHAVNCAKAGSLVLDAQLAPNRDGWVNGVTVEPNSGGLFLFGSSGTGPGAGLGTLRTLQWNPLKGSFDYAIYQQFAQAAGAGYNVQTGVAFDGLGNVFTTGYGEDGAGTHWVTYKSSDWKTFAKQDDFQLAPGKEARVLSIKADAQGNMFAAGWALDAGGRAHAIVRRLQAGWAGPWWTVVDYVYAANQDTRASDLSFDKATGRMTASLSGSDGTRDHWILLQWDPFLQPKVILDYVMPFNNPPGWNVGSSQGTATLTDAKGNLWAAGTVFRGGSSHWTLKERPAGVANWIDVDDFVADPRSAAYQSATPTSIHVNANGWVYVAGHGVSPDGMQHAFVRQSVVPAQFMGPGNNFATGDDWTGPTGEGARNTQLAVNKLGELYLTGAAREAGSSHEVMRRCTF